MYPEGVRENALALLRAMNDQQAKGQTDAPVIPNSEMAYRAGLVSADRDSAIEWLLDEKALLPVNDLNLRASNIAGTPQYGLYFYITDRGIDLVRHRP
jgi:hypothetical protein